MKLTYAVTTDPGSRPVNEDSVGAFQHPEQSCFVLCDGLGGHGMGDAASKLVVDVFADQFSKTDDMVNFLGQTLCASEDILMAAQARLGAKHKMKTTAAAVAVDSRNAYVGHVGDSRVYVFRKDKVMARTLDHSIPQMLCLSGEIRESQIRNHPDRNMLMRVLGVTWEAPMYELMAPIPLSKCQAFLLCSDGFWELIEEKQMCALLKKAQTVEQWLSDMEDVVRQNGMGKNMDNFSAIAVWTNEKKRFWG